MEKEIEELKELVRQNIAISTETNKMLHSMRAGARWNRFFRLLWWGLIVAATVASYFYLLPYITKIEQLYSSMQSGAQDVQTFQAQALDAIKNFGSKQE